ncbi:5-bromo-4-chloroindolyl phosphate hydrolysis family protein [Peribacillus sp. SCS-155]|uniref:5-bromo-4-chloroindolyl phosphate hydrolysis family protein n=1 Tax=Peribacillus sedimenti TaxID=3115297 RepID=UPI003906AD11
MNPFISFVVRTFFAIPIAVSVLLASYFGYNQPFMYSVALAVGAGALTFWLSSYYLNTRFYKKHGLSRKEYLFIKRNLDEAKPKIHRLHKALISIRHIPSLKQRIEFIKVSKKIYSMAKKEPKRFYLGERFFYSHLDSALELSEKYVLLASQPKKSREMERSLEETWRTLGELKRSVEEDLYHILSDDINQLHFEIDVAKHSLKK